MSFIRRFPALPAAAVLTAVSGVVIVDQPPIVAAQAASFGKICVVGEFEDGPVNTPTDILTGTALPNTFGAFGYQYGSQKYQNACAKQTGGTELWNGNAWVQMTGLKFAALTVCRVDTSIGTLQFTPLAYVQGTVKPLFNVTPGNTLIWARDGVTKTATFAATAATRATTAGNFTSFVGGETLVLAVDGGSNITVTFQAGDNSGAAIASRINAAFGFTFATFGSQLTLTSSRLGTSSQVTVVAGAAATTLGFTAGTSTGTGDAANIAAMTLAELQAKVTATDAGTKVTSSSDGFPRLVSLTAGTGTMKTLAGTANTQLGFVDQTAGTATTAALAAATTIPAGTRVTNGTAASMVVVMQSTPVAVGSLGTTSIRVRPAVEDGTYAGFGAGTMTTLVDQPGGIEWSVTNVGSLSAALTAAQLDAAYQTAIAACVGPGVDTTKKINGIVSARTSDVIRGLVKTNGVSTSSSGHFGRRGFVCPPNRTAASVILGSASPGVGAYRAEECSYCAGEALKFMNELILGGYSTTGLIETHPDIMEASRWSTLAPGLNPGQLPENPALRWDQTTFPGLGAVASTWDITTYAAFKAAGVCALEFDSSIGLTFEQGVTAVDPTVDPTRVSIARKTLADFIGDSLSQLVKPKAKRQGSDKRRDATKDQITGFLESLKLGDDAVVGDYKVNIITQGLPTNVVEYQVIVSQVQSDDSIVLALNVGPDAVKLARG